MAGIYQTKRGWTVQWDVGRDRHGKRVRDSATYATEAEAIARKLEVERLRIGTGREALEARWLRWIDDRSAIGKIGEKTALGYRQKARAWGRLLGDKPYKKLKAADIQRAYARLAAGETPTGRKPSAQTLDHYLTALRVFLNKMVNSDELVRNPARGVEGMKVPTKTKRAPTQEELHRLADAADADERIYGLLGFIVRFAAHVGLRRGELCGLRWQDVDLEEHTLIVAQAAVQPDGRHVSFKEPKTEAGKRRLSITQETVVLLVEHRRTVARWQLACGQSWADNDLVLPTPEGEPLNLVV